MAQVKWIVLMVLAGLLAIFTVQNVEVVEVRLLFWSVEMSRAIMLLAVLAIGMVLGWLAAELGPGRRSKR
ncbi:MAG: LapA family protein [Myxococcales bacterium]|nr:LapA family protein [Myxococcales bacterium]